MEWKGREMIHPFHCLIERKGGKRNWWEPRFLHVGLPKVCLPKLGGKEGGKLLFSFLSLLSFLSSPMTKQNGLA
jgi:hypothetical protein